MANKKNFSSYRLRYTFAEGTPAEFSLIVQKGPSAYGKHYVLDGESRKYLTSGASTKTAAISQMGVIAAERMAAINA